MDDDALFANPRTSGERRAADFAIFFRMGRIFKQAEQQLNDDLARYGLTPGLFYLLVQIGRKEGQLQRDLAELTGNTPANVSILLEKLVAAGLVVRSPAGRANQLFLTPFGRSRYDEIVPMHERIMADRLSGLSPEERQQLRTLLRKLERS